MQVFDPQALQQQMTAQHLSIAALARDLNMSKNNVSGWINARHRPSVGNIERISRALGVPAASLMKTITDFTPGVTGAVGITEAQALILAVAVALVTAPDPSQLAEDWCLRLKLGEQEALRDRLVITPHWQWAWDKLTRLGSPSHPLASYQVQVRIQPPALLSRRSS